MEEFKVMMELEEATISLQTMKVHLMYVCCICPCSTLMTVPYGKEFPTFECFECTEPDLKEDK